MTPQTPHFVWGEVTSPRDLVSPEAWTKGTALGNYMRYHGVYMPDLHTVCMSAAHSEEDADKIIETFKTSLLDMKQDGLL